MLENADVRLELDLTNRRVDVIGEGYDVAIRIRSTLEDSDLVVRHFGVSTQRLVAAPAFVQAQGPFDTVEAVQGVRGLGPAGIRGERPRWQLTAPDGAKIDVKFVPAFASDDVYLLSRMALEGVGVAQLPLHLCDSDVRQGRLVVLLPDHILPEHRLHAVYPSRRGMAPGVKAFIDLLAAELPATMQRADRDLRAALASAA
jgi:DNA-binding transcriptional LysR family regulator